MGLLDELQQDTRRAFAEQWKSREGQVVPEADDLKLGNDAVNLTGVVLYADLADSTKLVQTQKAHLPAEIFKAFLFGACKIIRAQAGSITSFDGDRVMAVFVGDSKHTSAAKAGLQINYFVLNVLNPALKAQYPTSTVVVVHAVGIDRSPLLVTRTGIRGANDLVWVGRAANYAAKLSAIRNPTFGTWITGDVFDSIAAEVKTTNGKLMWTEQQWTAMEKLRIFGSNWTWKP